MSQSACAPARYMHVFVRLSRYLYRVPLLIVHLLVGLPLTVLAIKIKPLSNRRFGKSQRLDELMIRWWQGALMWIFGLRLRSLGRPRRGPVVFAANHVSWIDISVMHSQCVMGFVAKQEIAQWPLVGMLAVCGRTIFHQRGSTKSLDNVVDAMIERLRSGQPVGVFPEGHARGGGDIGPFHARIFQAAVEASVVVQPVAISYGPQGRLQKTFAFAPGESFLANFFRLLAEPVCHTTVHFLDVVDTRRVEGRRTIAELTRSRIVAAMHAEAS